MPKIPSDPMEAAYFHPDSTDIEAAVEGSTEATQSVPDELDRGEDDVLEDSEERGQ